MPKLNMVQAINLALAQEMAKDDSVIVMGSIRPFSGRMHPSSYPFQKSIVFKTVSPRRRRPPSSRKAGTNQSRSFSASTAPQDEASWPMQGPKVPRRPWRCSLSMRWSTSRATTMDLYRRRRSFDSIFGSSS